MAVRSHELENQERGLALEDRAVQSKPNAEDELRAFRGRIAALKASPPTNDNVHCCRDCFRRGVEAAVRAVEGG